MNALLTDQRLTRHAETLARFKDRLRAGAVIVGMQHSSGSAAIAELVGRTGFDFILIDMEHTSYGMDAVEQLVRASDSVELVSFVRVLRNDKHAIMQVMDAGAHGVFVPHVTTRAECEAAVAALHYHPVGTRGKSACSRAARGGWASWSEYETWANNEPLLIPIIEDPEGVENLEEIVATPGLEIVAVGPGDLSQSYGEGGQGLRSPRVMDALKRTIELCEPRGIGVMTIPSPDMTPEFVVELAEMGSRVVWYGADLNHLADYFSRLVSDVRRLTS